MAGQKKQGIYCWKMESDGLSIYMASSTNGAVRTGLILGKGPDCREYFLNRFPGIRIHRNETKNRPLIKALKGALTGRTVFKGLDLDIHCTPFQRMVWEKIARIPFGHTRTYGEVALVTGRPGGARAVGQAMNKNPLPLIFP
jgi:O6-methylguanine-DNA--protein-cysteine methyltransferase